MCFLCLHANSFNRDMLPAFGQGPPGGHLDAVDQVSMGAVRNQQPTPPWANARYRVLSSGVGQPWTVAIPSMVAERTNLFLSRNPLIAADSNRLAIFFSSTASFRLITQ